MEYLDGENLSDVIAAGRSRRTRARRDRHRAVPLPRDARTRSSATHRRTAACSRSCCTAISSRGTSGSDADGRVKVLDFGIAKALSLSRKVTRNDFGSIAYLSPERLEIGDEIDAHAELWASACCSTRWSAAAAVPRRTRGGSSSGSASRQPPAPLDGAVRPLAGDRREAARAATWPIATTAPPAIRDDLERVRVRAADRRRSARVGPRRAGDEPATRRTRRPDADDEATRRTRCREPPPVHRAATAAPWRRASTRRRRACARPGAGPAAPICGSLVRAIGSPR